MAAFLRTTAHPARLERMREAPGLGKILVVEDSDLIQKMYDLILGRYRSGGTAIHHAPGGERGLAHPKRNPDTDLVVSDLNMPGMGGMAFIAACKANPELARIPILVASTVDRPEEIRAALGAGAAGYITKPFGQEQLHGLIARLFPALDGSRASAER